MTRAKIPHSKHEVVAAIGRRCGQKRKILVVGVYIPPWYNADQNKSLYKYMNESLTLLLNRYDNPYVFVAGDFNRRDAKKVVGEFSNIKHTPTGPTRGTAVLDIIACNCTDLLIDNGTLDPLEADWLGDDSDHKLVFARIRMPRVPQYEIEEYSYFRKTPEGNEKFGEWLKEKMEEGWTKVISADSPTNMVEQLHALFDEGMNVAYEKKTRKKKTSEPAWMQDWIRDLITKRRELFRKEKRSPRWHSFKEKITSIIKTNRDKFNAELKEKFLNFKDPRHFYAHVQSILSENEPARWNVRSLDTSKSDNELAESLATFFNNISSEYNPLDQASIPKTFSYPLPILSVADVAMALKKAKKKTSGVPGDISGHLYGLFPDLLAVPVTHIFNKIPETFSWPKSWKTEHVTVIPKSPSPTTYNECRNISCTNFLSKVYETFVLNWSRNFVTPKNNQFGGKKECGTDHFLVGALDYVTAALEDNRSAIIASSIDFSKAFNRLEHKFCLESFAKKGAPTEIIKILASFLSKRTMTVKVGNEWSIAKPVNAGAPQGSVLGAYLFNIGLDNLEEDFVATNETPEEYEYLPKTDDFPAASTPTRVGPVLNDFGGTPVRKRGDYNLLFSSRAANVPPWLKKPTESRWKSIEALMQKYIDDMLHLAVINLKEEKLLVNQNGSCCKVTTAAELQDMFRHLCRRAEEHGMLVNDSKTGLMCISVSRAFEAKAVLTGRKGEKIESSSSLKFLGFTLDADCTIGSHVQSLASKFRARTWALSCLKRAGMTREDLTKVYKTIIRPIVEYGAVAWHSMLTAEQSSLLEKQQVQAMRNIIGPDISARKMRQELDISPLAERREEAVLKFAKKCASSGRFSHWFPTRPESNYPRRGSVSYSVYLEENYKTDKRKNSPLCYMR